eukprot:6038595-Pyramimonas_sp.AAC.1
MGGGDCKSTRAGMNMAMGASGGGSRGKWRRRRGGDRSTSPSYCPASTKRHQQAKTSLARGRGSGMRNPEGMRGRRDCSLERGRRTGA